MNSKIPKRIIQTGKSFDLPLLSKAAVANVKLLNPDFEYLFFDNKGVEDFINEKFPEYRSVFDAFRKPMYNTAQKYDFFRYLAVYYFGGFYFDLDVFLASGLSDLLDCECVFPFEELTISMYLRREYNMDWEIGNYAFGAAAGHPFIYAIIQNCVKAQENPKWPEEMNKSIIPRLFRRDFYGFNSTGPGLVTRTLVENPDLGEKIKVLFPDNVCDYAQWSRFGSFGVHLMEGTWRHKNRLRRRLVNFWIDWTLKRLLKESLRLGESRSLESLHKK